MPVPEFGFAPGVTGVVDVGAVGAAGGVPDVVLAGVVDAGSVGRDPGGGRILRFPDVARDSSTLRELPEIVP